MRCESVIERTCVTCGSPHDKLATYTHRFVKPEVNALDLIAPGQRLPYMKGAAVAFGLMGMAEAIRQRYADDEYSRLERRYQGAAKEWRESWEKRKGLEATLAKIRELATYDIDERDYEEPSEDEMIEALCAIYQLAINPQPNPVVTPPISVEES